MIHVSRLIVFPVVGALLSLLNSAALNAQTITQDTQQPDWLPAKTELDAIREAFSVPGAALVAIDGCNVSPPVNLGLASIAPVTPVTDQTVFEAASLSKPVFAYIVVQLAAEGQIDLDQVIAEDFAYDRIKDLANYRLLTPRLILSHQAGLPNWVGDTDNQDRTDIISFVSTPGQSYSYSGEAYELLRSYVEAKTGKTLDELFKERLGALMQTSSFAQPLVSAGVPAKGYATTHQSGPGRTLTNVRSSGGAAGGLATTVSDYARFIARICHMASQPEGPLSEMLRPHIEVNTAEYPAPTSWGLGWGLMEIGPDIFIFHGGNNDEFRSFVGFSKTTGEGLVIFANGRNGSDMIDAILERTN